MLAYLQRRHPVGIITKGGLARKAVAVAFFIRMIQDGLGKVRTRVTSNGYIPRTDLFYPTVLSSKSQDGRRRNGDSASRTRRSAPLVPQSALFLLRKSEELSKDAQGRDSRHYSDGGTKRDHSFIGDSESTGAGRKDIEKDSPASRGRQTNSEIDNFGQEIVPESHDKDKKLQRYSDTSRTQEIKLELKGDLHSQRPGQFTENSRVVGLFRDLARLSREVDTLSEVQRKEEGNIKTYKQISATLESISASAATTIEPQLSRSLVVQADCKKVIEEKEKIMQRLWTDAVEALARDVTREVDVSLQAALLSIKQEARNVVYSTGRSHKRQRDEEEKTKKRDSNTMILEHKRRRGDPIDSSSDGLQGNKESSLDEIEV